MSAKLTYRHTLLASYIGYITQGIVNNLAPLLFVTFNTKLGVSLEKLGALVSYNFIVQILVDFFSARYVLKIGYRRGSVAAHILAALGLVMLGILPQCMEDVYAALMISTTFSAVGGGLLEVLVSPIVESLPGDEKAGAMSLLHSFYCWGQMGVVLLSTLYFNLAGIGNWYWLPLFWALIPLSNAFFFARVPLCALPGDAESTPFRKLFSSGLFWAFILLMLGSGASEMAMSQWSSMFAEAGLGVSKTAGDLLGPCAFAAAMGLGRVLHGIFSARMDILKALLLSSLLCVCSYLLAIFSGSPALSLAGCALTGLSVALMWPGTFSLAAVKCPSIGTAMFALLALAGDVGCSVGPGLVGWVAGAVQSAGIELPALWGSCGYIRIGLIPAVFFPAAMCVCLLILRGKKLPPPSGKESSL